MGMYTELVVSTRVKDDPEIIAILSHMGGKIDRKPDPLPDHPFFKTDRWDFMFQSSSYYFTPRTVFLLEYDDIGKDWCLIVRCDFKNYDDEVEEFISWLRPLLSDRDGAMFAYSRYEMATEPTIYYAAANEQE